MSVCVSAVLFIGLRALKLKERSVNERSQSIEIGDMGNGGRVKGLTDPSTGDDIFDGKLRRTVERSRAGRSSEEDFVMDCREILGDWTARTGMWARF